MKILICSILRNNERRMSRFFDQIYAFVDRLGGQHEFWISLYENDSHDRTPELLASADYSRFKDHSVMTEVLGTPAFGSVVAEERVKNLAIARNKALTAKDFYRQVDHVLFIDCDIIYDADFIPTLVDYSSIGLPRVDAYSGFSVVPREPHEHNIEADMFLPAKPNGLPTISRRYRVYDTWGSRRTDKEEWGTWRPDAKQFQVGMFWATYNSICLYNAKPFQDGIRFDHMNERLGKFDLEVAVVCEKFRAAGYDQIYVNQGLFCFHD